MFNKFLNLCLALVCSLTFSNILLASQAIGLKAESTEEASLVTVELDKKSEVKIPAAEAHSTFVQIILPAVKSELTGEFFDGNSPFIRKVALFSVDEGVGIRLFTSQDPKTIVGSLSIQPLAERILIHLDHKTVPPPLTGIPSIEEVVANIEVDRDIADPAAKILGLAKAETSPEKELAKTEPVVSKSKLEKDTSKVATAEPTKITEEAPSTAIEGLTNINTSKLLENKMTYVTVFVIFFIVFIVGSMLTKRILSGGLRKPASNKLDSELYPIANYQVGPRQKITLLKIENQKVLIGVSADQINYLTTIDPSEKQPPQQAPMQARTVPKDNLPLQKTLNETPYQTAKTLASKPIKKTQVKAPASQAPRKSEPQNAGQQSIEDVTNLIRKKLKNLPNV